MGFLLSNMLITLFWYFTSPAHENPMIIYIYTTPTECGDLWWPACQLWLVHVHPNLYVFEVNEVEILKKTTLVVSCPRQLFAVPFDLQLNGIDSLPIPNCLTVRDKGMTRVQFQTFLEKCSHNIEHEGYYERIKSSFPWKFLMLFLVSSASFELYQNLSVSTLQ